MSSHVQYNQKNPKNEFCQNRHHISPLNAELPYLLRMSRGKTSHCAFFKASLTVESALVVPLFFMAMVSLIMIMDMVGIQVQKNLELSNKARTAAMYGSLAGDNISGTWIDLRMNYPYKLPFSIIPLPSINIALRARVYPWIGKDPEDNWGFSGNESKVVYVTDYESVYHTDPNCTHLDLTVTATTTSRVSSLRNIYGNKYKKCDNFPEGYSGTVYITSKGDRYYPSLDYPGLTRHVHIITEDETTGKKLCERCAS